MSFINSGVLPSDRRTSLKSPSSIRSLPIFLSPFSSSLLVLHCSSSLLILEPILHSQFAIFILHFSICYFVSQLPTHPSFNPWRPLVNPLPKLVLAPRPDRFDPPRCPGVRKCPDCFGRLGPILSRSRAPGYDIEP